MNIVLWGQNTKFQFKNKFYKKVSNKKINQLIQQNNKKNS